MVQGETKPNNPTSDYMFSGHTFFIVMVILFLWYYKDVVWMHFHFPKIGSALGGGDWGVIESIINHRVTEATKNLYELK